MKHTDLNKDIMQDFNAYVEYYKENITSLMEFIADADNDYTTYLYAAAITPDLKEKIADDLNEFNGISVKSDEIKFVDFDLTVFASGSEPCSDIFVRIKDDFIEIKYPRDPDPDILEGIKENQRALAQAICSDELEKVTVKGIDWIRTPTNSTYKNLLKEAENIFKNKANKDKGEHDF